MLACGHFWIDLYPEAFVFKDGFKLAPYVEKYFKLLIFLELLNIIITLQLKAFGMN